MMTVGANNQQQDTTVSPHNSSGPVFDAVSAYVCTAVVGGTEILEMQFDKKPLFSAIIDGETKAVECGKVAISLRPRLGVTLDRALV